MCRMIKSLLLAAVVAALTQSLSAFPFGAPISSCKTLQPEHTSPTTCGRNCPFKMTLIEIDNKSVSNPPTYRCGALHKLRLQTNGDAMKGFVVQARQAATRAAEFDDRAPYVGRFVDGGSNWKLWGCDAPSATHSDDSDKTSIDLLWRAPDTPSPQSVVFWYTAVIDFAEYYVRLKGPQLNAACSNVESAAPQPLTCTSDLRGLTLLVNCSLTTSSAACRINGEPPSLCTFPYSKDVSQLAVGTHALVITAPDISVPTVINFTIQSTLSLSCKGVTDDFSFTVNCNSSLPLRTVLCAIDDFPPRSCTLPFKRLINPTSPPRTVSVFVTGMNGVGATTTVDLVGLSMKCEAEVDQGMTVTVNCTSNNPIATAQCALDEEPVNPCIIPYTRDVSELMPGSHRVLVTAATANGSSVSTTASFNVPIPGVTILKCEGDVINSILTITCDSPNEITNLQCSLDQNEAQPCTFPYTADISALSPGEHTFTATITGTDGEAGNSIHHFTIPEPMVNSTLNDACSSALLLSNSVASSECEEGCPYTLSLVRINGRAVSNVLTYRCGATYTVSLSSKEDPFTEVAVQVRATSAVFDIETPFIGQFVNANNTMDARSCGTGAAIKISESPTKNVQMTWQAPKLKASNVTFWYSIKTMDKIFIQLRGPTLDPDPRSCAAA